MTRTANLFELLISCALVAVASLAPANARAAEPPAITVGQLVLQRCDAGVYCGHLARPLDPAGGVPGDIRIYFEYYPKRDRDAANRGTMVAVEGGPGYPSTGTRANYLGLFSPLRESRDVVIVDNRGTGHSQVVTCEPLQTAPAPTVEAIAACGRSLGDTAALFGTAYAADDLDAVLTALGRGRIDLYGDSYGTYFSQVFSYRHPDRLRSLVLDSAYPVAMIGGESAWYPFFAPTMRDEFNKVCARSKACAALPGDSITHTLPALEELRAHPFEASARDADGRLQSFSADPSMLALTMLAGAPAFAVARELDAAARAFGGGDTAPLLRLMAEAQSAADPRSFDRSPRYYSEGLFWAVSCQDYAQIYDMTLPPAARHLQRDAAVAARQRTDPQTYFPFSIDEFRAMSLDYSLLDACVGWPAPPANHPPGPLLPPDAKLPAIPVLVLSGELDTITTPTEGAIVAGEYPLGRQIVISNRFHVTALPPALDLCGVRIARHFIEFLDPGDTSCAAQVAALRPVPRFARTAADVPAPQSQPGNEAGPMQLQAAAAAVLTLGDALARLESNSTGEGPLLRGGRFVSRRVGRTYHVVLSAARWADDVTVDATLEWPYGPGIAAAKLRLRTSAGSAGMLDVTWPEQVDDAIATLEGRIDGRLVRATMPAP